MSLQLKEFKFSKLIMGMCTDENCTPFWVGVSYNYYTVIWPRLAKTLPVHRKHLFKHFLQILKWMLHNFKKIDIMFPDYYVHSDIGLRNRFNYANMLSSCGYIVIQKLPMDTHLCFHSLRSSVTRALLPVKIETFGGYRTMNSHGRKLVIDQCFVNILWQV